MSWDFSLRQLPKSLKLLTVSFILVMFFGYGASFILLYNQTGLTPAGIEKNYNGNEDDDEAEKMIFEKSSFEMLTTFHSHVFTLGVIFLLTGFIMFFIKINSGLRTFLMIEPLLSLIVSFTSLILMWQGLSSFKFLVHLSGGLMHLCFLMSLILILKELLTNSNSPIP